MIISIDLDGTIADECDRQDGEDWADYYERVSPVNGAIEAIRLLKEEGNTIIIYSARWEEDREVTESWLVKHEVPYDTLVLGKPYADCYVDNRALQFRSWHQVLTTIRSGGRNGRAV